MMAANKTPVETGARKPLTFVDCHGATVAIAPGDVQVYTGIKAEQLRALTQLLAGAAAGDIDLSPNAVQDFTLLANQFATELEDLIDLVADDVRNSTKGA